MRDIQRPVYGLHNDGCPNLLWELRQARREELSAGQLLHRNPTERIVDKNNHLRDCLKYLCLSTPEPAEKTQSMREREAMDATSVMAHFGNLAQPPPRVTRGIPVTRRAYWKMKMAEAAASRRRGFNPANDKNMLPFSFY
jgi:hypothetical protein